MDEVKVKKTGKLLFFTGVIVTAITLGGFYLSQNPEIIAEWRNKSDSARKDEMRKVLLVAPESCISVSTSIFEQACSKVNQSRLDMESGSFEGFENYDWTTGFSQQAPTCMRDSFRITTAFKLEYDGQPASKLMDIEDDSSIIFHACDVSDDLELTDLKLTNLRENGAKHTFDAWYKRKYNNGNYFGL